MEFDQWLVDSAHDYYNDVPIPSIVEKILVEICAGRKEEKSIKGIRFDLRVADVKCPSETFVAF